MAVLAVLAALPSRVLYAQVPTAIVTESAEAYLRHWYSVYYNAISSGTCNSQDCSVQRTLNTSYYNSDGAAAKTAISGSMQRHMDNWSVFGGDNASYRSRIYAKIPANQEVVIKIPATTGISWTNMKMVGIAAGRYAPIATVGVSATLTGTISTVPANSLGYSSDSSVPDFNGSKSEILSVGSKASGSPVDIGGEPYYLVGYLAMTAQSQIRPESSPSPSITFNASVGQVEVKYKGKALNYDSGGGQTWITGRPLPDPFVVKVIQDDTGQPVPGETITFQIQAPANGAILGAVTAATDADGIARTTLTLGSSPGIYTVNATCPGCVAAASAVNFTATAKTNEEVTELSLVQCDKYAGINSRVNNAFIVRAFNTLTRAGEPGLDIAFSASAAPPGASGQQAMPGSVQTNDLGIAFVSVWTGDKTGPYTYTAECPSCGQKPDAQCALSAGLPPSMAAEPEDVGPVAGNPDVTPMLRISNIGYPNDGVSFTTLFGENKINLAADLKPDTPEYNALSEDIAWEVVDSPADAMDSGDPVPPANGAATYFYINHPHVPAAPTGRQFPLKYKIQARVTTSKGLVIKSYPRHIRQDDIDKCRQEYFDLSTPEHNLTAPGYFSKYTRPLFTPGTDGEFVKYSDCFAHIYPEQRAREALSLRAGFQGEFGVTVTSGYRSARHNKREGGAWNSVHQFGEAVDIQAGPVNGANMKKLWLATDCPKILESRKVCWRDGRKTTCPLLVLIGACDGSGLKDWDGTLLQGEFAGEFNTEDNRFDGNKNKIPDILEDLNPKNGIADIFDRYSRTIHMGR